jgi:casein kinase II subunit alpha
MVVQRWYPRNAAVLIITEIDRPLTIAVVTHILNRSLSLCKLLLVWYFCVCCCCNCCCCNGDSSVYPQSGWIPTEPVRNGIQPKQYHQAPSSSFTTITERDVHSDYENMRYPPSFVTIQNSENYLLTRRLGTGKFSDVFEAVDVSQQVECIAGIATTTTDNSSGSNPVLDHRRHIVIHPHTLCVLKCLKPVHERKIRRELLILHRCLYIPNLIRLVALIVPNSDSSGSDGGSTTAVPRMPSFVLRHAGVNAQWLCHNAMNSYHGNDNARRTNPTTGMDSATVPPPVLSRYEIQYYLYHLLIAMRGLHDTVGIMHRDIKPRNVLINRYPTQQQPQLSRSSSSSSSSSVGGMNQDHTNNSLPPLTLIDLGLADFYQPGRKYNVRVASRHYKCPEILMGYEYYTPAIDVWGFGCIMASLLLYREPFFRGKDNIDQLGKIISVLGTGNDLYHFLQKYDIELTPDIEQEIIKYQPHVSKKKSIHRRCRHHHLREALLNCVPNEYRTIVEQELQSMDGVITKGLDLLETIFVYDHQQRPTTQQIMQHPFFDLVRSRCHEETNTT